MDYVFKNIRIYLYKLGDFPTDRIRQLFELDPEEYSTEEYLRALGIDWTNLFEQGYKAYKAKWDVLIKEIKINLYDYFNSAKSANRKRLKIDKVDITDKVLTTDPIRRDLNIQNTFGLEVEYNNCEINENNIIAVDITHDDGSIERVFQGWITEINFSEKPGTVGRCAVTCHGLYKLLSINTFVSDPAILSQFEEGTEITSPDVTPFTDVFTGKTINEIFDTFMHHTLNLTAEILEYDRDEFKQSTRQTEEQKIILSRRINYYSNINKIAELGYKDIGQRIKNEIALLNDQIKKTHSTQTGKDKDKVAGLESEIRRLEEKKADIIRKYRKFNIYILLLYLWFYAFNDSPSIEKKLEKDEKLGPYDSSALVAKLDLGDWRGIQKDKDGKIKNWRAPVAFLEATRSNWSNYYSGLTTPMDKLKDIYGLIHYEIFENNDGQIVLRPPTYNSIGDNAYGEINTKTLMTEQNEKHVISAKDIIGDVTFDKDDSQLLTRSDYFMKLPFFGKLAFRGGHFTDLNLLLKYGLRATPPKESPMAQNQTLAGLVSALALINSNAKTRTASLRVTAKEKFKIGKLYYIQPYNKVGYLSSVAFNFNLNTGIASKTLQFTHVRSVEEVSSTLYKFRKLPTIIDITQAVLDQMDQDQADNPLTQNPSLSQQILTDTGYTTADILSNRYLANIQTIKGILSQYITTIDNSNGPREESLKGSGFGSWSRTEKVEKLLINYMRIVMGYDDISAQRLASSNSDKFLTYDATQFSSAGNAPITQFLVDILVALDIILEFNFGIITVGQHHIQDDAETADVWANKFHESTYFSKTMPNFFQQPQKSYYLIDAFFSDIEQFRSAAFQAALAGNVQQMVRGQNTSYDLLTDDIVLETYSPIVYKRDADNTSAIFEVNDIVWYRPAGVDAGDDYIIYRKVGSTKYLIRFIDYLNNTNPPLLGLLEVPVTEGYKKDGKDKTVYALEKQFVADITLSAQDGTYYIEWPKIDNAPEFPEDITYRAAYKINVGASTASKEEKEISYINKKISDLPGYLFIENTIYDESGNYPDTELPDDKIEKIYENRFSKRIFEEIMDQGFLPIGVYYIEGEGDFSLKTKQRLSTPFPKNVVHHEINKVYDMFNKLVDEWVYNDNMNQAVRSFYVFANINKRIAINKIVDGGNLLYGYMTKEEFLREIEYNGKFYYFDNPDDIFNVENDAYAQEIIQLWAKDTLESFQIKA